LCDAVISVSAATEAQEMDTALNELKELLAGPAKVGLKYHGPRPDADEAEKAEAQKLSGTPLYLAATLDCAEAAKMLIEAGASLVAKFEGLSPIEAAVKHSSTHVLAVFLQRIKDLEKEEETHYQLQEDNHQQTTSTTARRPPLRRGWTHTSPDGHREARLHRRSAEDEPEQPTGHIASVLATSDGYEHAPAHESGEIASSSRTSSRNRRNINT